VSYQVEERYWTDYVRLATPIVGLLLLLGVFWYWASSLIGDQSSSPPVTPPANVTVIPADTPTPTPTEEVALAPETAVPTEPARPAEPSPTESAPPEEMPTDTPEVKPTAECPPDGYAEGEVVLVSDNDVRLRAEPSTSADILDVLTLDQAMTILDCQPQEAEGIVWWHVRENETGEEGWVADDWLKPQE
jgi:hypothetical protein